LSHELSCEDSSLSSFFTGYSTLSPFSKYKVDLESRFNSRDTTLNSFSNYNDIKSIFFCEDMTLSPFFTGDTTLSSFSNRDSTLSLFPNKTLNHSFSKGLTLSSLFSIFQHGARLWVAHLKGQFWFVYLPERYVCMNAWKLWVVWMHACACLNAWNFDFIFFNMHVWMREILRMHLWMHEHLEKCTYENAFWECIFFLLFLFSLSLSLSLSLL